MPRLLPSSRGRFRFRLSPIDFVWAAAAPPLALYLRDAQVLSVTGTLTALFYCALSFVFTLIAFRAFRVSHAISRYFSVHDAISIISAVIAAGLITTVVLFTFTRLDGIPRSIPILQGLVLSAGLLFTRGLITLTHRGDRQAVDVDHGAVEHIIMIGSSRLTSLFIQLLQAHRQAQREVVAILDDKPTLFGRTLCGAPIVGTPDQLESVIDEFAVHGIRIDRVLIGGDQALLSSVTLAEVRASCAQRDIVIDFVPDLIGLSPLPEPRQVVRLNWPGASAPRPYELSSYFRLKRVIDFTIALFAIVLLSPVFLIVSVLVLLDVGSPIVFWQKRMGRNGRSFLLYKFRTLHAPFDGAGQPTDRGDYSSWIGKLLRALRLDELPQLFNVLVGEMSLIGPRPLLPQDQPTNCHLRLMVRPGITGWAQVSGGSLITIEEKGALNDWYIRNASFRLDLRIILFTVVFLFTGERRFEQAVQQANVLQQSNGINSGERKPSEVREIKAARAQPPTRLPISARGRAPYPARSQLADYNQ
jgi:lipopolysaccharide/colanic/teichoic acid biosynthesis glycosyltransferase